MRPWVPGARLTGLLLALLVALPAGAAPASPAPAPERGFRIALYALPPGLGNPYTGTALPAALTWPALFETLTVLAPDGRLEPQLAVEWRRTDPVTWRFRLREGVRFSNGEPFDAAAAHATFEYLQTPKGRTEAAGRDVGTLIAATRVVGPHELEVRTKEPAPLLPELLSVLRMVAPRAWRELGPAGFAAAPVGTGPFKVVSWEATRVRLVRNPLAWRPPRLDALEIIELPDPASRVQALQSGRIDAAVQMNPDDAEPLASAGARLIVRPGGSVLTLQFNTERSQPLRDPRVRRALNLGADREKIARVLFRGQTVAASQATPRIAAGYDPTLRAYPYDPAEARRLLAEAGYADGLDLTAEVVVGSGANDALAYQSVAADLRRIGVNLTLRTIPAAVLIRNVFGGGWRGDMFGMDYGTTPTLDAMRPFRLHSCLWPKRWYCDESLVPLIRAARVELDEARRLELTREVLRRTHAAAPAIFLYEVVMFDALSPRVTGWRNAFHTIDYAALDLAAD
ncbi:MAG: ABC transporter substrate-binding protein [Steroidobacteraceae bacterium]|nr:ABC transporter substrate-binding protein [Steroidobacteraceae bacterium]